MFLRSDECVLTKRLLLEDEENGVRELNILDVIVDHIVKLEPLKNEKRALDTRITR